MNDNDDWRNWGSWSMLEGVQNDITSLEDSLTVSYSLLKPIMKLLPGSGHHVIASPIIYSKYSYHMSHQWAHWNIPQGADKLHLLYLQKQNKTRNSTDANHGFTCKCHNLDIIRLSRAGKKRAGKPQKDLEEPRLHITKSKKPVWTGRILYDSK